jgi:hypothetical protein
MTNTVQNTNRRGFLRTAAKLTVLGLVGKCIYDSAEKTAQMESEIKPVAIHDLNGDGKLDYIVESAGSTALPNHYSLNWYDGSKVREEVNDSRDELGNVVINRRYFAKGFSRPCMSTHIKYSTNPSEPRFYTVEESESGEYLDIVVADNTPDFPVTIPVYRGAIAKNPKSVGRVN